ncbi:MAG: two-component sensor histidine kinase [Tetrasphaera sp.]|nr:two-component sensor histidine kinase [Tetrasphaera sp.]
MHGSSNSWRSRRIRGVPVIDLTLASALGAVAIIGALRHEPPEGPDLLTLPVAVVMCGALSLRRIHPFAMAVLVSVPALVQALVSVSPGALWALAVYLVATVSVATHDTEARAAAGGGLLLVSLFLQEWLDHGTDYVFIVLVFGGAWLIGRGLNAWTTRALSAEATSSETARLAVAEERLRVARELHDVVAHSLGVIAVQSEAADALLERDPTLARASVQAVRSSARGALDEMRQLLGVLRAEPDGLPLEPQPRLAGLAQLVDSFTAAGLRVALTQSTRPAHLRPGLDLTAFRIVQESLSNVLRHAGPVPVSVSVTVAGDALVVEVRNASSAPGPRRLPGTGLGLIGLRERVQALDGTLVHGPDGSGFRVTATLPLSGSTA